MSAILFLVLALCISSKAKELTCTERDHCNGTLTDHRSMNDSELIKEQNCFCDQACFQYDDCCEDIKHLQINQHIQATCVDYMYPFRIRSEFYEPTVMPVWMITTCLSNYQYTRLEKNCSSMENSFLMNPPAYIPMTSRRTNFTYRNIYCAQCNNENIDSLMNWPFQIVCNGLKQNYLFNYRDGLNMLELPPPEAERCINRLSFPSAPAIVHPCKQQTINSCPSSYSENQTIIDLCSKINAYRYVTHSHPIHMHDRSLYRNEYCLICDNVTHSLGYLDTSCEHQLDDELIIDPKPKTGRHGIYRLSILFDPNTFSTPMPILSLSDYQYHSSYQTHFTTTYPCRYFELYDYILHTCIMLHNEDDWRLTRTFNCANPILIRDEIIHNNNNNSMIFFSRQLDRQHGDFIRLFSDAKKLIICGEHFPLLYIHHNRFITTIRYSSTIISLLSLLIFMISFTQNSILHNLPGKCLLMLAISLQFSQSIFLLSGHLLEHVNHFWCICSGIGIHFFYLSTFAWLTAISFDTCLTLTRMTRLDARMARARFILYNIFVWLFSLTIVLISVCLHAILSENNPWSPSYGRILCSISSRYALIALFLLPIGCLVLINVIIFTRTIFVVRRIDRETKLARCTSGHDRSRAFLYFRLAILMGIHWIFLLVCILFKHDILWLIFDIINSLPGLFIAISFLRKPPSLGDIRSTIRSSQSQLSSLGMGSNTITSMNNIRCIYSSANASPNVQMSRRLDDITQKLDNLTRHLLKPNDILSTPSSFHHRSVSSL